MDQNQSELQSKTSEQIHDLLNRGQAYATQFGARAQEQLRERPFVAVAGAVALGFIVGALLSRRSRRP